MTLRLAVHGRVVAIGVLLLVLAGIGAQAVGAEGEALRKIAPIRPPCAKADSEARFARINEYFLDANPRFASLLSDLETRRKRNVSEHGVTYVYGMPGLGKTFFFQKLKSKSEKLAEFIKLDKLKDRMKTRLLPDLSAAGSAMTPLSHLPAFPRPGESPDLLTLMKKFGHDHEASPCPYVIFDSLDEIHPLSAAAFLERLDVFMKEEQRRRPSSFLHVFVVGRPEGFLRHCREGKRGASTAVVELRPPVYRNFKELEVAAESSRLFHKLPESARHATLRLAAKHNFICESTHLLSGLGRVVRFADQFERNESSERQMKDRLFEAILERNTKVDRPAESGHVYIRLLEKVALRYANAVDANGFFVVAPDDAIEIELPVAKDGSGQRTGKFLCVDVLNRSGLTYVDLKDVKQLRYRWTPSWLHEHLVYRHGKRAQK